MVRLVALLRGINVPAKSTRVSMEQLRNLFKELGFQEVRTLLNSGNVVFSAPAKGARDARARIEKALAALIKIPPIAAILSRDEVETVVRENPLSRIATNPSHLLVVVPAETADLERLKPLLAQKWSPEGFGIGSRAAYVWCAYGAAKSPLWLGVERALKRTGTARNIVTMTKLLAMLEEQPS
jgi:uncharacterized protein (DUF1697 family)